MDEDRTNDAVTPDPGAAAGGVPETPPTFLPPEGPPTAPGSAAFSGPTGSGADASAAGAPPAGPKPRRSLKLPDRPGAGPRLSPSLASMVAVGGGLLAIAGLFFIIGELGAYDNRGSAIAVSLLFTALGVAIAVVNRSRRAAAAGVALSAISLLPLLVFVYFDPDRVGGVFGSSDGGSAFNGVEGRNNLILITAALVWFAGWVFVPGRRYGFYLGATLIALWLIPMNHFAIDAAENTFSSFGAFQSSSFDSGSSVTTFDSGGTFDSEGNFIPDDTGDNSFQFDDSSAPDLPETSDPTTKLGVVSLVFAAVYLGAARWRDGRGDAATGTAILVPGLITVTAGFVFTVSHMGPLPGALFLFTLAAIVLAVGLGGSRRLSSWYGLFAATAAVVWLVGDTFKESPRVTGGVLTVVGIGIALAVGVLEGGSGSPGTSGDGLEPPSVPGEGHPVWGPAAAAAPPESPPNAPTTF